MPFGSRNDQRLQAKINRTTGQVMTLLIPASTTPSSTATPLSISSADTPVDLTTATAVNLYGSLCWKSGQFRYAEGGETLVKVAEIEIPADWASFIVKAYAVRLVSGEILIKKTQALNESATAYTLTVESHIATTQ